MTGSAQRDVLEIPLLETKLFAPHWRSGLIARPKLVERFDHGTRGKLTLVSAPAGFGKSTLLAEWIAQVADIPRDVAWLSLDQQDREPSRFWGYVIAALQRVRPGTGQSALSLLQSPQPPPIETILTTLINDLAPLEHDLVLILDDFHAIDSQPVHAAVDFLLDHLPPRLHLVITSRSDPPLMLARLRARGDLVEIRAADLQFTESEAATFLREAMGLPLSADDIAVLERRTEGWIAGLQLAALSLQGRDDVSAFIRTFAGDHRHVVDYLVEEVLQRQPERLRRFLLQTSILDRLSGSLCDAVTGRDDSRALLGELERGNLFVVPLDDTRHWFRYHHLFAHVLRVHALAEEPEEVPVWHLRASAWYQQHHDLTDAVRHSLAAHEYARSADLIERALPELRRERLGVTLLGWLRALPDDLIRRRPALSVAYAWALMSNDEFDDVEARLRDAERLLEAPSSEMMFVDVEEFRSLPGTIAVYRAVRALALGDVPTAVSHARRAFELAPEEDHLRRGAAAALLGLASWTIGDLESACRSYIQGMEHLERASHIADVINGVLVVVDIKVAQGRLREAERALDEALQRSISSGDPPPFGTPNLYIGMSELRRERNDLTAATQYLLTCQELASRTGMPYDRSRWCTAIARIKEDEGDPIGALDLLDEAEHRYVRDLFPNVRPVGAVKARVLIARGNLADALSWAREQQLSAVDTLSYVHEFEHITLARLLLARARRDGDGQLLQEALVLLERLRHAAEEGGRTGSLIEILILQALAHQSRGKIADALGPLERALTLAEPEGYFRIFVDEGPSMAQLLDTATKRGISPVYARRLLTALGTPAKPARSMPHMIEPLSEREQDVLRLLASELGGPEIADELMISLNTLRTHTKNIYSKLGVNSRRAAVRRAGELDLL